MDIPLRGAQHSVCLFQDAGVKIAGTQASTEAIVRQGQQGAFAALVVLHAHRPVPLIAAKVLLVLAHRQGFEQS
jgi:hypothetical protein